jgi:hypothetical protein
MFRYRELSEPTRYEEAKGEWVDFPASPNPDPWAALMREANRVTPVVPRYDYRKTKPEGGAMKTSVAIALRGLLVTTTAVAIVAYLLLTNSHI